MSIIEQSLKIEKISMEYQMEFGVNGDGKFSILQLAMESNEDGLSRLLKEGLSNQSVSVEGFMEWVKKKLGLNSAGIDLSKPLGKIPDKLRKLSIRTDLPPEVEVKVPGNFPWYSIPFPLDIRKSVDIINWFKSTVEGVSSLDERNVKGWSDFLKFYETLAIKNRNANEEEEETIKVEFFKYIEGNVKTLGIAGVNLQVQQNKYSTVKGKGYESIVQNEDSKFKFLTKEEVTESTYIYNSISDEEQRKVLIDYLDKLIDVYILIGPLNTGEYFYDSYDGNGTELEFFDDGVDSRTETEHYYNLVFDQAIALNRLHYSILLCIEWLANYIYTCSE